MLPDAPQTKTSICPGVSIKMFLTGLRFGFAGSGLVRFSSSPMTWSILVANRFRDVRIPPLGPRLYL